MTTARQIIPGSVYLITRRCSERRFFLKPSRAVKDHVTYLLAEACERFQMGLLGAIQMANHLHVVVHDPGGRLPAFMQRLHGLLARALNVVHGRCDGFWDVRQPAVTELCDPDAVLDTLAYVACNPVAARLVARGGDWPGLRTAPGACAAPAVRVSRPRGMFSEDGAMPAEVPLRVEVPPTHAHMGPGAFAALLTARVRDREAAIRAAVQAEGQSFGAPRDLERLRWDGAPTTPASGGIRPKVIARDDAQRVGVLTRIALFERSYARALGLFRGRRRGVEFPGGTWQLPTIFGANVARPPPPAWRT